MKDDCKCVSIVIPVYNVSAYLRKCLDSVIAQTYRDIEIIVVNDGSTDNSLSILEEYAEVDSRIKIITKNNGGLMSAWIEGMRHVSSDYVMFVDSDDWIDTSIVEKLYSQIAANSSDVVIASYMEEYESGESFTINNTIKPGFYKMSDELLAKIINNSGGFRQRGIVINRWGKIIKTKLILENIKYCDLSVVYGEDVNIMVPVIGSANSICIINDPLYHYRMNKKSITHSYVKNMKSQIDTLYSQLKKYVSDEKKDKVVIEALKKDNLSLIICCIRNEAKLSLYSGAKRVIHQYNDENWIQAVSGTEVDGFSLINRLFVEALKKKSVGQIFLLLIAVKLAGKY